MKVWEKIDRFYPILIVVLIMLSALVVFVVRGIFTSIITSFDVQQEEGKSVVRVDKSKLDSAYSAAFNKEVVRLNISQ